MKTGKNETQNISEMLVEMNEAKEKGLTNNRGKSVYRKENGEYQEEKLKDLISMSITELAEVANKEKISLDDVEEVKRRTIYYMRACEESGTFPTSLGLARSLGYSDRALRHWRSKQPNSATSQWLELVNEMCADILNQSALKGNANTIVSIFLSKALYELRETNELVITSPSGIDDGAEYSAEEIRRRYLPLTQEDEENE